jgi:hypothetical protein
VDTLLGLPLHPLVVHGTVVVVPVAALTVIIAGLWRRARPWLAWPAVVVSVLATGLVGLAAISGEALAQRVPASSLVAARAAGQVAGRLGGRDDRVSVVLADVVWCRAGFAVPAWRRIP